MRETISLLRGMRMMQDDTVHLLGLDTVLLADFATLKKNARVCDLGAGAGALSLLLAGREKTALFDGLEIASDACKIAEENIKLNGLKGRMRVYCADLCSDRLPVGDKCYDLVVSNPPYFAKGTGKTAQGARFLARSETACPLTSLVHTAGRLLKWGGYFAAVYRPERLCELIAAMKDRKIEPKRLRLVCKDSLSPPSLILLEGKFGASPGLKILPPLFTKSKDKNESDEIKRIYGRDALAFHE